MGSERYRTYETGQPWVCYEYLHTDDEADALGYSEIEMVCAICGEKRIAKFVLPKCGEEPDYPPGYKHEQRVQFLSEHVHKLQQTAPETWRFPLLNPDAHTDTLDILRDVAEKASRGTP